MPAKAKLAIAVMLEQPKVDLELAAKAAGLTAYRLRMYLKLPHVARYFRAERQVVLDSICAGNPVALKAIRDEAKNKMAAVAAVRGLELMRDGDQVTVGRMVDQQRPGVTIIFEAPNGRPEQVIGPVIEHEPVPEFEPADQTKW